MRRENHKASKSESKNNNCVGHTSIVDDDARRMNSHDTLRNEPIDEKEKEVTPRFA